MVKVIISDFSRVLLFPVDKGYLGSLNSLNNELLKSDSNYDFTHHFTLNIELLCYYQTLGMPVYIFTSVRIQEHPAIKDYLRKSTASIFSARDLGIVKTDSSSYELLASMLNIKENEILYIDDSKDNVDAAKEAGCQVLLYESNSILIKRIDTITSSYSQD
jgi:FMN phosphatase YigB (HAD superfamily)